jgi:hypothetical protein
MTEGVLCECGNLFKVESISQYVTLVFLCDPCQSEVYELLSIPYGE